VGRSSETRGEIVRRESASDELEDIEWMWSEGGASEEVGGGSDGKRKHGNHGIKERVGKEGPCLAKERVSK
jgi:hypothetical protein